MKETKIETIIIAIALVLSIYVCLMLVATDWSLVTAIFTLILTACIAPVIYWIQQDDYIRQKNEEIRRARTLFCGQFKIIVYDMLFTKDTLFWAELKTVFMKYYSELCVGLDENEVIMLEKLVNSITAYAAEINRVDISDVVDLEKTLLLFFDKTWIPLIESDCRTYLKDVEITSILNEGILKILRSLECNTFSARKSEEEVELVFKNKCIRYNNKTKRFCVLLGLEKVLDACFEKNECVDSIKYRYEIKEGIRTWTDENDGLILSGRVENGDFVEGKIQTAWGEFVGDGTWKNRTTPDTGKFRVIFRVVEHKAEDSPENEYIELSINHRYRDGVENLLVGMADMIGGKIVKVTDVMSVPEYYKNLNDIDDY